MSTLAARKHVELSAKLASLLDDFAAWQELSATEGDPLRLHKSQIEKVTRTLGTLAAEFPIAPPVSTDAGAEVFLNEARNTENMILAIHSVWAFFRKKLAQRLEPGFRRFLDAADELAWVCYKPALDAAGQSGKEPPLVFLNGALSPFMVGRDNAFLPEDVPPRFLGLAEFKTLVARLPVPVIGLPWAQAGHLPDTLSVAHEAGHVVEEDLALTNELIAAVRHAVPGAKQDQWLAWRAEIFADLWACAALGPAYVSALCDFLAADPLRAAEEMGQQGAYPTANLRVFLNVAALRLAGFTDDPKGPLAALLALWPEAADVPQKIEAEAVVAALLQTPLSGLGGKSVHAIFGPFRPQDYERANDACTALEGDSGHLGTKNVRTIFAGVRQGYDADPASWRESKIADRLLALFDRDAPESSLLGEGVRAVRFAAPAPSAAFNAQEMLADLRRFSASAAK